MKNYDAEILELKHFHQTLDTVIPMLSKELAQLIGADQDVVLLLYSRRSLEIIVREICEKESIKISDTIPLKGTIDKLKREEKVPANIITCMYNLNNSSVYGAHAKDFDSGHVRTALINLASILKWFIDYKGIEISSQPLPQPLSQPKSESSPQKKSIIVLPFENMSPDPDQDYFSDGLTEEIITDLSYIHDLLVISRNSAMTFKGSKLTTKEIAQKVNATHVLEGSVRKAGNQLRITAQLIDADTDTHLWAEKYDGILDDILKIQETVAATITEKLKVKFTEREKKNITDKQFENPVAFELYLKARYKIYTINEESYNDAINCINKALEIEENSLLYAELAYIYWGFWTWIVRMKIEDLEKARYYIQKAFSLNPQSPDALFVYGLLQMFEKGIKECVYYLKRTLEILPNHESAMFWLCAIDSSLSGRIGTTKIMEKLKQVNPFHPLLEFTIYNKIIHQGDMETAARMVDKYLTDKPDVLIAGTICYPYIFNQQFEDVKKILNPLPAEAKENYNIKLMAIYPLAFEGKIDEVKSKLDENFLFWVRKDFQWSYWLAGIYALINHKDEALNWLENSVNLGFVNYPFLNEYFPFLDNIRGEFRFKQLMQKVKYEWENFEV